MATTTSVPLSDDEKPRRKKAPALSTAYLGSTVELNPYKWFVERGVEIPSFVWREPPFKFNMPDVTVGNDEAGRLKEHTLDANHQAVMFQQFSERAPKQCIYPCSSDTGDGKPLYFAAYIVQSVLEHYRNVRVQWASLNSFVYMDKAEYRGILSERPSNHVLVLTGIFPDMDYMAMRTLRDLHALYRGAVFVPVVSGTNALSFFANKAHLDFDLIFHYREKNVRSSY